MIGRTSRNNWRGCRGGGNPVHAVYRKHFPNPIGKTTGSDLTRLTLSGRVRYHRAHRSWCRCRYDVSVNEAIARAAIGPLPACYRRACLGTVHFPRIASRASSQGHARHRALHVDVRRRTGPRYGDCPCTGAAFPDLWCRNSRAARLFVTFLVSPRLPRSPERFPHIAYSDVSNDPVRVSRRAGLV